MLNIFCILLFLCILNLESVHGYRNRGITRKLFPNDNPNPWEEFMRRFDIPKNHGSGVKIDLGGEAIDKYGNTYRYTTGMCPVYSKLIHLAYKTNFLKKLDRDILTEETFLEEMRTGNIKFKDSFLFTAGIQFPSVNKDEKYRKWISPVNKDNAYQCAKYVKQFEHLIQEQKQNDNCESAGVGKCLKQSFIYDLETKLCYILYPTFQIKNADPVGYDYLSYKALESPFVFGSTNIREDWQISCPMKPIKGAIFGKWNKRKGICEEMKYTEIEGLNKNGVNILRRCGIDLFNLSAADDYKTGKKTNGEGYNWANWSPRKRCIMYKEKPDCLIYEKDGYAFTSVGIADPNIYDLPPCNKNSDGWKIIGICASDAQYREYTCNGCKWMDNKGNEMNKCLNSRVWANNYNNEL